MERKEPFRDGGRPVSSFRKRFFEWRTQADGGVLACNETPWRPINETKFFYGISCRLRMKRRGNGIDEIGFSAVLLCLAVFLISNTGLEAADSGRKSIAEEDLHKPGEILVKFNPDISKEARNALHERIGATVVREFKSIGVQQLQLRKGLSIREALLLYRAAPVIEYAESVGIVRTQEGMEGPQNPGVMEGPQNPGVMENR